MARQRLSVMLATPPGFNAGMAATELALRAFLRRRRLEGVADCYRLVSLADRVTWMPPGERLAAELRAETGVTARSALDEFDALTGAGAIVFWADYLHMGIYLRELEPLVTGLAANGKAASAAERLRRLLLLEGAGDATLARTVSFGTTLLFNTLRDELDACYAVPLRRFLSRAKRVWVRDALSAARVAHLRNDYETGYFGVDCALLLTRDDVLREAAQHELAAPNEADAVLLFAGRDPVARDALHATALELGAALDRPVRWLRWGDRGGFPHLAECPLGLGDHGGQTARELLYELAHAAAVVTDTYHLAVCAWNLGVPAVASFTGHAARANDVSSGAEFNWRDKREVFYSQYDALDFLIRPEELIDPALLERRTRHLCEVIADGALRGAIVARIRSHAESVESALAAELAELLGEAVCR